MSYLEPSPPKPLRKRIAKKVQLIRQALGELGTHRNEDKTGWVAVPLARLCNALGFPTSGKRYSALRKLMEYLADCGIVHDDEKRWGTHSDCLGLRLICRHGKACAPGWPKSRRSAHSPIKVKNPCRVSDISCL